MTPREDFSEKTKKTLADRVGWRCSYLGCGAATIGPHLDEDKTTLLGEAAHITAAAPRGPRYDARITSEQRTHVSNGIWMCRMHSRLIDADEENFSENTLKQWKILAEKSAYDALGQGPVPGMSVEPDTLIAFGLKIVIKGVWISGGRGEWRFRSKGFCRGDLIALRDEIERRTIKFVVVESQGDGRLVSGPVEWNISEGILELTVPVSDRAPRRDPAHLADLALTSSGDLLLVDGDLVINRGIPAAIQEISLAMSEMLGEVSTRPNRGALSALYFHRYSSDLELMSRLFTLEIARLATIPVEESGPPLNTVWRVNNVKVPSLTLVDQRLTLQVELEWSDGQRWAGSISVYIHENLDRFPKSAGT